MDLTCDDCFEDHFLGVKGLCNASIGICICPKGFSGKDDWVIFNSCHVDELFRETFHLFMGIFASLCFMLSGFMIFTTFKRYRKLKIILKNHSPESQPKLYSARDTFVLMIEIGSMNLFSAIYDLNFFFHDTTSVDYFQLFLFALMNFFQVTAAFTMVLSWVQALPSVEIYGQLLGINPFLVKYPNMAYWVVVVGYIYAVVRGVLTIVLLAEDSENVLSNIQLLSDFDAAVSFPAVFFLSIYAYSLRRLLRKSIDRINKSQKEAGLSKDNKNMFLKTLQEGLSLCKWFNGTVVGFVLYALINLALFTFLGGLNQYFFIGLHFGILNLVLAILMLRIYFSYKLEAEISKATNNDQKETQTQTLTVTDKENGVADSDL